jgi:ferredoxin hydrogenase small subunit
MSIISTTRRGFLKGACILSGGLLLGVRMVGKAYAGVKEIKGYMADRINAVYKADVSFPRRASQDNAQVKLMYQTYIGKPLSPKAEELLHTRWFDKSAGIKKLMEVGVYPGRRLPEFKDNPYLYEE